MNVTELARKLRVTTKELLELLPQFGFDIGARAIKIDPRTAQKILKTWPQMYRERQARLEAERKAKEKEVRQQQMQTAGPISLPSVMTVRDFAARLNLPVNQIIGELMGNGILATLNERIDYDTAAIVAEDFGFAVTREAASAQDLVETHGDKKLKEILNTTDTGQMQARPPVVVVMGHVDHGKTKLLDAIRRTHVMDSEHGGITQHIGAYQTEYQGRSITFIDTPGHEAFTAMRSRGAKVADIAILIVAADDSIKPQTVEAIQIIQALKLPFVVAINKIDKPEANLEKVKQDLAQRNLLPEDWGGGVVCVPISAKAGTNIEQLLETILLVADLEADKIKADPARLAIGTVIEAHKDPGEGAVATILVQSGTLHLNDILGINGALFGKVRSMKDWNGAEVASAPPGMPVKVLGWKQEASVGDILEVVVDVAALDTKKIRKKNGVTTSAPVKVRSEEGDEDAEDKVRVLKIILKSDALGSAEAIGESLEKLEMPGSVGYKIVSRGLGNITETDILQAEGSDAVVLGFNVQVPMTVKNLAAEKKVEVQTYKIIYELLDFVKAKLNSMVEIEIRENDIGSLEVLALFKKDKTGAVVGGRVKSGRLENGCMVRLIRDNLDLARLKVVELQSSKQFVTDVEAGTECGLKLQGKFEVAVGDTLQAYREEKVEKKVK
ncbi:translation initiation factor IF-2 [Candidatus Falkowbacteria bacterium]|nr:translation initiation factor IF-2 [Candidatus Falkowbacteria bacterium]